MAARVGQFSLGSIFYHFIDARRRPPEGIDDFRAWLAGCGDEAAMLCARLADLDPAFDSLVSLRERIATAFHEFAVEDRT
jgi:hypothetical protein